MSYIGGPLLRIDDTQMREISEKVVTIEEPGLSKPVHSSRQCR